MALDCDTRAPRNRLISFDGCFNFRDLGGYRAEGGQQVRWDRLYRADGINRLQDTDLKRFAELGIVTVIDLRTSSEVEKRGVLDAMAVGARYHHLPLVDVIDDMSEFGPDEIAAPSFVADRYQDMLRDGADRLAAALAVLAQPEALPAVFHCAAGKDRTGILAAIVLRLLGVSAEDVTADYALSQAAMQQLLASFTDNSPQAAEALAKYPSAMLGADPSNMARFLDAVESECGSMAAFVASLGVANSTVDGLRAALLEEAF
jgi:protein-tyrosine phosphatase